jgi:hypothetical protein
MTSSENDRRLDKDAGPVVRPYALTGGRTRPAGDEFGLIDTVATTSAPTADAAWLGPENGRILDLCRRPVAVADIASDMDLPLGVVRVLLSDLRHRGLITVSRPAYQHEAPDVSVMRSVLDGLKAL